ncbi:MAG: glycoside hydrolase superfamily [Benniella sp.]|nr:MAG: glycoside hydrolase superfamily [Benniella sp.]
MRLPRLISGLAFLLPAVVHAQRVVGPLEIAPDYPAFSPSDLPTDLYTHLNFGFALINDQGLIESQGSGDIPLYKEMNELKKKKPALRTAITIGGWDMNMAHYSEMVSTAEKRQKFIQSAMAFVREHGFDGLDFDWEYEVVMMPIPRTLSSSKEMREAVNAEVLKDNQERLILSIALPGGPFHGDYFVIPKLANYVDWFNIMAYNLHGPWESMVFCAAPLSDSALGTEYNGYSLVDAVHSMAPKAVNPRKINLGLSLSGVSFTLSDQTKTTSGSPASGPGKAGCQERGATAYFEAKKLVNHLDAAETKDMLQRQVIQPPRMDETSKCMYMVVDHDQWIGLDTPETFAYKVDYLKDYGFGGVSIWSMDSDTSNHELTAAIHNSLVKGFVPDSEFKSKNTITKPTPTAANVPSKSSDPKAAERAAKGGDKKKLTNNGSKLVQMTGSLVTLVVVTFVLAIK